MSKTILRASTYGKGASVLHKALSEHLPFSTSGALRGDVWAQDMVTRYELGSLNTEEANRFMVDHLAGIAYVVWSYRTPIAWVLTDGTIYRVGQRFSPTTSKHQGKMYLLG